MPTRDDVVLLASYSAAMNARLYAAAATLPQDALRADRGALFGSIIGTLNHIVAGDTIWLRRFMGHPAEFPALNIWMRCWHIVCGSMRPSRPWRRRCRRATWRSRFRTGIRVATTISILAACCCISFTIKPITVDRQVRSCRKRASISA